MLLGAGALSIPRVKGASSSQPPSRTPTPTPTATPAAQVFGVHSAGGGGGSTVDSTPCLTPQLSAFGTDVRGRQDATPLVMVGAGNVRDVSQTTPRPGANPQPSGGFDISDVLCVASTPIARNVCWCECFFLQLMLVQFLLLPLAPCFPPRLSFSHKFILFPLTSFIMVSEHCLVLFLPSPPHRKIWQNLSLIRNQTKQRGVCCKTAVMSPKDRSLVSLLAQRYSGWIQHFILNHYMCWA